MRLILLLYLFVYNTALAEEVTSCIKQPYTFVEREDESKGNIFIFKVKDFTDISATTIACVTGELFLGHIYNMPDKAVISIVSEDYTSILLTRWDLTSDYFMIIESGETSKFVKYPEALKRIKEILINKQFPTREELPTSKKLLLKSNYLKISKHNIKELVGE